MRGNNPRRTAILALAVLVSLCPAAVPAEGGKPATKVKTPPKEAKPPAEKPPKEAKPPALTPKAIGVSRFKPLSDTSGNAGLFVGVNEFTGDPSLSPLRFAANDAIAIAHLFIAEIGLVPADRAIVLISGEPAGPKASAQLDDLRTRGVHVGKPRYIDFFRGLRDTISRPEQRDDLLVLSLSSHGFEERGTVYVMPCDGLRASLFATGIKLSDVEDAVGKSKAGKRLLVLDTCRENPLRDGRGGQGTMTRRFREALSRATGQAILTSCTEGQVSFEDPESKHGVFTHYLLEALRGQAPSDVEGFIRLNNVLDYVSREVEKWSTRNSHLSQQPWFKGSEVARQIPLAVDPGRRRTLKARLESLRALAVDGKIPLSWAQEAERLLRGRAFTDAQKKAARVYVQLADGKIDLETAKIAITALRRQPIPAPAPGPRPQSPRPQGGAVVPRPGQHLQSRSIPSLRLVLVRAPDGGVFRMGYNGGKDDEKLEFGAELTHSFFLSETEITFGQFRAIMGQRCVRQPFAMRTDQHPITNLSFELATKFCQRLGKLDGVTYRLPTEAEWEYACRAGSTSLFGCTDEGEDLKSYAVWDQRRADVVGPRASPPRKPNRFGLFDMHGNAAEMTCSAHLPYPHCPAPAYRFRGETYTVVRGGSYLDSDEACLRASIRVPLRRSAAAPHIGFRILRAAGHGAAERE